MPVNGPQRGRRSQHSRRAGRPGASGGVRHPAAGIDNVELDYPASPGGKNASDHMESGFFNKYALDEAEGRKGVADPPDVKSGVSSGGSVKSRDRVEAAPDPENSEMTDGVTRGSHRYSNKSGARCQNFWKLFHWIESFATLFTLIRFRKSQLQSQLDSRLRSFESQLKRLTFHLKFGREKKWKVLVLTLALLLLVSIVGGGNFPWDDAQEEAVTVAWADWPNRTRWITWTTKTTATSTSTQTTRKMRKRRLITTNRYSSQSNTCKCFKCWH